MNKTLLTVCFAAATMAATAQNAQIACQWANLIDGETAAGDQSTDIALAKDGGVYWFGTYGSIDGKLDINYGGNFLYTGASYTGTSNNGNFTLLKTDSDGARQWVVYSNSGDWANNSGGCVTTSDGGVVVVSKFRHTDGFMADNINLVGTDGNNVQYVWNEEGTSRQYRMMVTKVSAEGAIEWNRVYTFSDVPENDVPNAKAWVDCFNLGNVAIDSNDNVFVAINYKSTLTIEKSDGTTIDLKPVNNTKWNGDSQTACGDWLILGLDNQGYYRNALTLDGTATVAYAQKVVVDNDIVYAQGYITGADDATLKAGDKVLAPSSIMSPTIICADTDLNVKWAKCFKGEAVAGKTGFQNCGITAVGGTLWVCGMYNLKFTDPDNADNFLAATQGSIREGFILKLDAATGEWISGRDSRDDDWNNPSAAAKTGLTGYLKVLQNAEKPDKIYVYGYVMNAAVGVFLRQYDAVTLNADLTTGQNNIVTQGGVPSAVNIAYDPKNCCVYLTARGNKAFTLAGADAPTAAPSAWGILAARYSLPDDMYSAVGNIAVDGGDDADANAPVMYYNLQGQRIDNPSAGSVVIRRQGNTVSKTVVR